MKLKIFIIIMFFISGCKSYTVDVNNYSTKNNFQGKTFLIGSGDPSVTTADLQFQEFADFAVVALSDSGYVFSNTQDADLGILISYKITEPQTYTTSHTYDTYGYVPSETYNYSGTTNYYSGNSYAGRGNTSGTITTQGGYKKTGTASYNKVHTLYGAKFIFNAYDYRQYKINKTVTPVWTSEIVMISDIGDIREAIPLMLYTAREKIGNRDIKNIKLKYVPSTEYEQLEKFKKR